MTADSKQDRSLFERLFWLIRLRWLAVAGVILTIGVAEHGFGVDVLSPVLYGIAGILAAYNLLFLLYLRRAGRRPSAGLAVLSNRVANAQISLDLLTLAVLIHFSGGVENPFIFYFIFHMIIASILLSRRDSFLQATLAVALFSLLVILEYFEVVAHYCLAGFAPTDLYQSRIYILGVSVVFVSTLYIAVYMATSISGRLRERESSLREANALLEAQDRIKSEYVLQVTHDIRSHLSAIQSCIDVVAGNMTGKVDEAQKDMLARIRTRAGRLQAFVRDLLEITRLKLLNQLEMEPFSLAETFREVAEDLRGRAESKNLKVRIQLDSSAGPMQGVRAYVLEALSNLMANAVRYTPPGGQIEMKLEDRGHGYRIEIRDTGIGIPADEVPHVFDEFYRARNAKKQVADGTGLGLALTKMIVEMHQGRITLESQEGGGTTFRVELPKTLDDRAAFNR